MHTWHGDNIFCNNPYSVTSRFMARSFIDFENGKNIVMLIPEESAKSGYAKKFLQYFAIVLNLGTVKFDGYDSELRKPVCLVLLLQPELWHYL